MTPEEFFDIYSRMIAADVTLLSDEQRKRGIASIRARIDKIKEEMNSENFWKTDFDTDTKLIEIINNVHDNITSDMSCNGDYWGAVSNAGGKIHDERLVTMCASYYRKLHEHRPERHDPVRSYQKSYEYWACQVEKEHFANINDVYTAYVCYSAMN